MIPKWAEMSEVELDKCKKWVKDLISTRLEIGKNTYHSDTLGFQGDPLNRLEEEAIDLIIYTYWSKRYMTELESTIIKQKTEIEYIKGLLHDTVHN